jgi:hypothetical protein
MPLWQAASPMTEVDLETWLREQCAGYTLDVGGVFRKDSELAWWPVSANDPVELEARLADGGHLLPLPKEPAALANVLEVSIVDYLMARIHATPGASVARGTERGYPDLEVSGEVFGGEFHAVDIKAARRNPKNMGRTQSRITLYTGNTYFRNPEEFYPGMFRPFGDYATHLDVLMIYTFEPDLRSRVTDLEIIVQEPWRIGSRDRSSTTREYIGAVLDIDALREGRGVFQSSAEFYAYWRAYEFKVSNRKLASKRAVAELEYEQESLDDLQ